MNSIKIKKLQLEGVNFIDSDKVEIRGNLICDQGVEIDTNIIIEGEVNLGKSVKLGPNTIIRNSSIGSFSEIKAFSSLNNCKVGDYCMVGPYARLRTATSLDNKCQIGNFVEIKNSSIGKNCRINHMAFVGDATLEDDVTIGAGTITCNHNGLEINKTLIESGAYIGSNVNLVAPVKVAKNATIGSGSTITKDVAEDKLTLARSEQITVEGWKGPK
tara:strand:- start:209 stop:856 length:648 start_codon:yes stop_codon:yes gene_type:complete